MKLVKSIYGKVILNRARCPYCEKMAIVIDNKYQCCGSVCEQFDNLSVKRMIEGEHKRSHLKITEKREIIKRQNGRCFYCGCDLDNSWYISKKMKNPRKVGTHFDHLIAWVYTRETNRLTMVASCNICNMLKGAKMFRSIENAIQYVLDKRSEKGIEVL